jgi:microcin C transport system substrate-binding protein
MKKLIFCFTFFIYLFVVTSFFIYLPGDASAAHGVSIDGKLKYSPGFKKFDYASEKAEKGGAIVLHDLGSFDKMNPFTLKGTAPLGLNFFVFETLSVSSLDEPFAQYGLIAKNIELAEDKLSVTFTLDKNARFSDGTPVTPEDVKFTLDILKSDLAHPSYQIYLQDITDAEIIDSRKLKMNFARKNRELHMIASQLPVLSRSFFQKYSFDSSGAVDSDVMVFPVGSGPYVIDKVVPGKSIRYRRNQDYWAKDHAARKGLFNFDSISVEYYQDQIVSVEALKAGEFDFMAINIAKQWERDLNGQAFASGKLIKKKYPHHNNAGMQGFVFNTRRKIFQDPRIRKSLGYALDFEWTNRSLFFDQYTRSNSYFSNSNLAASGLPGKRELELLIPFKDSLPQEVFSEALQAPTTDVPGGLRTNLKIAATILQDAGWNIKDGIRQNRQGETLSFEILLASPSFERVMAPFVKNLKKIGVKATYRTVDMALYEDSIKRFDYDMVVNVFGQSQSPGNEQRGMWHSMAADKHGSRNLAGVSDSAVDKLVDSIIYAETQEGLTAACQALDRVLWHNYYVIPNWYLGSHRLVYNSRFRQPAILPLYYDPYQFLMTWWDGTL